jgi:hypothetical protein
MSIISAIIVEDATAAAVEKKYDAAADFGTSNLAKAVSCFNSVVVRKKKAGKRNFEIEAHFSHSLALNDTIAASTISSNISFGPNVRHASLPPTPGWLFK